MSRYRFKLVPQGAIPRPLDIAVRMTPKAAASVVAQADCPECPESPCVSQWLGWDINVDGDSASGTPIRFQNDTADPVVIHVGAIWEPCDGDCIVWNVRSIVDGTGILDNDVVISSECVSIDLTFGHSQLERYPGFTFAIYPTINDFPFGEAIIFLAGFETTCQATRNTRGGYTNAVDGGTPPNHFGMSFGDPTFYPNAAFTLDVSDAYFDSSPDTCGAALSANLSFIGGDPDAYGDFTVQPWLDIGGSDIGFRLSANGAHDYTDIQVTMFPYWTDDLSPYGDPITVSAI